MAKRKFAKPAMRSATATRRNHRLLGVSAARVIASGRAQRLAEDLDCLADLPGRHIERRDPADDLVV